MSNYSPKKIDALAGQLKALSNPSRLKIFLKLAASCEPGSVCCTSSDAKAYVGELGKGLGLAPSTVSHHIKELNTSGLVHIKRKGKNIECWVEPRTLEALSGFFAGLMKG